MIIIIKTSILGLFVMFDTSRVLAHESNIAILEQLRSAMDNYIDTQIPNAECLAAYQPNLAKPKSEGEMRPRSNALIFQTKRFSHKDMPLLPNVEPIDTNNLTAQKMSRIIYGQSAWPKYDASSHELLNNRHDNCTKLITAFSKKFEAKLIELSVKEGMQSLTTGEIYELIRTYKDILDIKHILLYVCTNAYWGLSCATGNIHKLRQYNDQEPELIDTIRGHFHRNLKKSFEAISLLQQIEPCVQLAQQVSQAFGQFLQCDQASKPLAEQPNLASPRASSNSALPTSPREHNTSNPFKRAYRSLTRP